MKPIFLRAKRLLKEIPKIDFHLHTVYTDGISQIGEYIRVALEKGIKEIAFTEHVDKTTNWFDKFADEIIRQRKRIGNKLKIYYGVEARALDYQGNLNASPELINNAEIVVGVVHSYPAPDGGKYWPAKIKLEKEKALDFEFRVSMALLANPKVDIFGHPGATFEQFFGEFPLELYRKLIRQAKKHNKAVEINPQYQRNLTSFVKICLEENPLISLGSNAHHFEDLGQAYYKVKEIISNL